MQYGPARTREKSATSSPDSGPGRADSLTCWFPSCVPFRPALSASDVCPSDALSAVPPTAIVTWGAPWNAAQSALIAPAAWISSGRCWPTSTSSGVSAACELTLSAAITVPSPSRSGTATDLMPGASCSSVSAQPRARTSRSAAPRSAASGCHRGVMPDLDGSASTRSASAGGSAASSTLPSEVCIAGNRVPIVTASVTIFGTATRATYTMSEPSSWAIDVDSRVRATSASMCGRAISHRPRESTYDMPRSSTRGVSS